MSDTWYTDQHEWLRLDGDTATAGISAYAAEQLGDVVYVELPEIGRKVKKGDEIAVVESVKAASEVYAPADGEVVAVNDKLTEAPETVNAEPEGAGWFFRLKVAPSASEGLMDAAAYRSHVGEGG